MDHCKDTNFLTDVLYSGTTTFGAAGHVGSLQVLRLPPTSQEHVGRKIGYAKLPQGVNKNVNVYMMIWNPI